VRTRAVLLAAIVLAGLVVAPLPASAASVSLTVADAPGSVAYLREAYGVSEREALRRLELQQASTGLAQRLAARFPDEYGGIWLDQAGGGRLIVGMTRPDLLAPALAGVADAAHVRAARVTHSLRTLRDAADRIASRAGVPAAVDAARNTVVVPTTAKRGAVAAAAPAGVPVEIRDLPPGRQKACDPRFCTDKPLRAGIRLDVTRDDGSFGGCTTGFNLMSATGEQFVLSAGHCVDSSRHQNVDLTFHQRFGPNKPVTIENESLSFNAFPNDYAIMPFQQGAFAQWFDNTPAPTGHYVNVWCPGGCAGGKDLPLTGLVPFADIQIGWVVCATGSGYTPGPGETYVDSGAGIGYLPGTRCGEVTGRTSGGIDVLICARPGDSGGPLFTEVDRKALGILSFGDEGEGPCTNPAERNFYAPLSTILAHANSVSGLGFRLIAITPVPHRPRTWSPSR